MKLSTKGRYGLRALVDLGTFYENEAVSINSIAKRQNISERYLEQIVAKLKKAGIVKAIRGASGGYILARAPEEISVGDILRALEGNLDAVECSGLSGERECEIAHTCVTKYVWKQINDSINETVDEIKLSQLIAENKCVQQQQSRLK